MSVWLKWTITLIMVAAFMGLSLTYAAPATAVPTALQVPEGNVLRFKAYASGTQNYECQRNATSGETSWVFKQPKATLLDEDGQPLGIHGRGPFWSAYDGSRVVGSRPISFPAADAQRDVPLLLLQATSSPTEGRFSGLSYIQRLETNGGAAPAGACDPEVQPTLAVPYLAVYYFYGPA